MIHNRTWRIEQRRGRLPEPPRILQNLVDAGKISARLTVRYKGPLTLAQDQMFSQRKLITTLSSIQAVAQYDPAAAADKIDVGRATEHILDQGGFWQDSIRDDEAVAERQELREKIEMAQIKGEMEEQEAKTEKDQATAQKILQGG